MLGLSPACGPGNGGGSRPRTPTGQRIFLRENHGEAARRARRTEKKGGKTIVYVKKRYLFNMATLYSNFREEYNTAYDYIKKEDALWRLLW